MKKTLLESCLRFYFFSILVRKPVLILLIVSCNLLQIKAGTGKKIESISPSFENATVRGTVSSQTGESMPGVNIILKGTTVGTTTDADGKFALNVPEGDAVLVFSFIGFVTQEVAVNGRSLVDVILAEDVQSLREVVVVGYGEQKKLTMTGSVSSIKGEDIIKAPVTNVSNSLVGRLPGLTAVQRSGEPGRDGSTIRIRGVNSLGNNDALIVVDGIPGRSLDRIDVNSIESITVLKDASAAIYGSQAANGVILITTKRGKLGKPEVTINLNQGYNQPARLPDLTNAAEYATMMNEIDFYANKPPRFSNEEIEKFSNGSDPWNYPNTDWFAEVLKPWSAQNFMNASLSGGDEKLKYYISLGSKFQDGYYRNSSSGYKQYDFRSNIDGKISENVSIAFDIYGRMEDSNYPVRGSGNIFGFTMISRPIAHGFWPNGNPGPSLGAFGDNPVVTSTDAVGYDRDKMYSLNTNLRLNVKIPWISGLSLRGNASLDKAFRFRKLWQTPWYLYSWDRTSYDENNQPVMMSAKSGINEPQLQEWMEDNQHILLNGLVNYEKTINKHFINLMAGMESRVGKGDNFNAFRRYYISSAIDQLFAGGNRDMNTGGSGYENARLNYFGRANYNYAEKYLIEFVWRYDGSYIFPEQGRYGFFPGVSAGWRLSEENFWKDNLSFIENFKVRASWGQTGNDRIPEWQYLSSYSYGGAYIFGINQQNQLLREARIPNHNVTWEIANQSNFGLEASLLNSKLFVELDYFTNKRSKILWQRDASVPLSTGLTLPRENIGKVSNKGFDFNIGYQDQARKLRYSVSLNGGYAKNEITFWDESPGAPVWQQSTGHPIPTNPNNPSLDLYYEAIGIFKNQEMIDNYPHRNEARPGDVIFKDVNNDGIIDDDDRVRNDKTNLPRFTGGININLGYAQFDFSVLFQGAAGAVSYVVLESGEVGNYLKSVHDGRWTPENPDANKPRTFNRDNEYWKSKRSTQFLESTDFIRLKTLELGYKLPISVNSKLGIQGLRVYVSGFNLFTISPDSKDFDPEYYNANGLQGGATYPVQRVINGGLTLTF